MTGRKRLCRSVISAVSNAGNYREQEHDKGSVDGKIQATSRRRAYAVRGRTPFSEGPAS
jgi:hypothetical protein